MTKKISNLFHYTGCGLNNIYLSNGYTVDADDILFIEDVQGLHKAIGDSLVYKTSRLNGKEVRFMRHYMDLSQKAFGELLGVDYQTVLRWETGRIIIPKTAERLLRVYFGEFLDPASRASELIKNLSDLDNGREQLHLKFAHAKEWQEAA